MRAHPYLMPFGGPVTAGRMVAGIWDDITTQATTTDPGEYGEALGRILTTVLVLGLGQAEAAPVKSGKLTPTAAADSASVTYPPADGAVRGSQRARLLPPGTEVGRRGPGSGRFGAPPSQPAESLSLPPATLAYGEDIWVTTGTIKIVESEVAAWFGQPGGGVQWVFPDSLDNLPIYKR